MYRLAQHSHDFREIFYPATWQARLSLARAPLLKNDLKVVRGFKLDKASIENALEVGNGARTVLAVAQPRGAGRSR